MHEKYSDLLHQYIDGGLNFLEKIILEEHLANCPDCRRELNQLKLMDWDLKHEAAVEIPSELKTCRIAAVKAHLADTGINEHESPLKKQWRLQRHILQHTFSFISYNPVNRTVTRSASKTVSLCTRAVGRRIRKHNPLLTRFIPGQT